MKKDTHPLYYPQAKIICACGKTFVTGATRETIKVELCSFCHPFYTGKQKLVDTLGMVEKFRSRQAKAEEKKTAVLAAQKKEKEARAQAPSKKKLVTKKSPAPKATIKKAPVKKVPVKKVLTKKESKKSTTTKKALAKKAVLAKKK